MKPLGVFGGGTSLFEGVTVPEVTFQIGRSAVVLSPARVTLQLHPANRGGCYVGNIGLDLLRRMGKLDFDFSTMVLKVEYGLRSEFLATPQG